ncbi:hypothetical protein [Paenibacillus sinopodophylli]|uniref:hypothetical protein n=1 Tax=Paenibacillus sinopodophylli TaxID=1837342 RepID=UPI00110CFC80|nr:hypothetical protein [Paenibacillus sinopodophylli]
MFKSGFALTTDDHLAAGQFNQIPIVAWEDGEIINYRGVIEKQDAHTVTINSMHYVKTACEFKVR